MRKLTDKEINARLWKGIGGLFVLLLLLCLFGLYYGCSTGDPSKFQERQGCIQYFPNGEHGYTYERVIVVGDNEEGEWLLYSPDSSDKSVRNVPKKKVQFLGCPGQGMFSAEWR